jgi:hypothetical protein
MQGKATEIRLFVPAIQLERVQVTPYSPESAAFVSNATERIDVDQRTVSSTKPDFL